jgi:hypothetical protein
MSGRLMDDEELKDFISDFGGVVARIAKRLLYATSAIVALWFIPIFFMGGSAKVRCSYGRMTELIISRSQAELDQFCAASKRQRENKLKRQIGRASLQRP